VGLLFCYTEILSFSKNFLFKKYAGTVLDLAQKLIWHIFYSGTNDALNASK